jgi:glycosyltransferase involved in cell wall biosynthesis
VIGRVDPDGESRYPLGAVDFVPLPHYPSLSHTLPALRGMLGSLRPFWRALDQVDCVWILGPHPLAFPFALMARLRRRSVILGVRQDSVAYMRSRHPRSRARRTVARLMDAGFHLLARRRPVVVVGPAIAESYRKSRSLLEISISLVPERQIDRPEALAERDYSGELTALSVGRIEKEKNPLALADMLAALRKLDGRWRLVVCGEGELRGALEDRLRVLGVDAAAEIRGYVPHDHGLDREYRLAHALVHVSWTEGLPQILYEAFAAALPVVATDVGGIASATAGAALLTPPGDPESTAAALARIGRDEGLRLRLVGRGVALAREHTIESETAKMADFIQRTTG